MCRRQNTVMKMPKAVWQLYQHRKRRHFHGTSMRTSLKPPSSASARKRNKPPMPVAHRLNQSSKDRANDLLCPARTPRRQSRSLGRAARSTTPDPAGALVWLRVVGSRVLFQRTSLQGTAGDHQDRYPRMDIVYRVIRTRLPLDLDHSSNSNNNSSNTTPMHRGITSVTDQRRRVLRIQGRGDSRPHRRRHSRDRDQDLDRVREVGPSRDRCRRCLRLRHRHQRRISRRR
jgi:hypothetical protein